MRASSVAVSIALISSTIAFPLPADGHNEARGVAAAVAEDAPAVAKAAPGLLAKLVAKFPALENDLVKTFGSGALVGGAGSILSDLLGSGTQSAAAPAASNKASRRGVEEDEEDDEDELSEIEARDLEARFKLPTGLLSALKGPLVKELGKGAAVGGVFSGLAALLGGSSDSQQAAPSRREIEERGIAAILEKLIGDSGSISSVLKKALLGGAASGAAIGTGDAIAGQSKREDSDELTDEDIDLLKQILSAPDKREVSDDLTDEDIDLLKQILNAPDKREVSDDDLSEEDIDLLKQILAAPDVSKRSIATSLAKLFEGEAGAAIKKGLVNGAGSAAGGVGIAALLAKFGFGGDSSKPAQRRSFSELEARVNIGTIGKGLIGTGVSLGASSLIEEGIEKIFGNARSLNELD